MNITSRMAALALSGSMALLSFAPTAQAAVLVTTGTDAQGRAYIELPRLSFDIVSDLSTTTFALVIQEAFSSPLPTSNYGAGGGGIYVDGPGYDDRPLNTWTFGMTKADVALMAQNASSYNFAVGQTWTTWGERFTLSSSTPVGFPVFATGYYDIVLQDAAIDGRVLSAPAQVVPEPSTVALLGAFGLAALVFRRRLP